MSAMMTSPKPWMLLSMGRRGGEPSFSEIVWMHKNDGQSGEFKLDLLKQPSKRGQLD
jgi:hypothetical protein